MGRPRKYVSKTWGPAGFEAVTWIPSQALFAQALVVPRRLTSGSVGAWATAKLSTRRTIVDRVLGRC